MFLVCGALHQETIQLQSKVTNQEAEIVTTRKNAEILQSKITNQETEVVAARKEAEMLQSKMADQAAEEVVTVKKEAKH